MRKAKHGVFGVGLAVVLSVLAACSDSDDGEPSPTDAAFADAALTDGSDDAASDQSASDALADGFMPCGSGACGPGCVCNDAQTGCECSASP